MGGRISDELKELIGHIDPDIEKGRIEVLVYTTFDERGYEKFLYKNLKKWTEGYDIVLDGPEDIDYSRITGWHFSCAIDPQHVKRLAEEDFVKEIRLIH